MTNVTTVAAMRPRRIALAALAAALLSGVAFMAMSPSTAQAAQQWNQINRWRVSGSPFFYTREPTANFVRTKTAPGIIKFSLSDNVTGGICVRVLRAANGSLLGQACWLPGEYGDKTLAVNVPAQRFTLWAARRGNVCTNDNPDWNGKLYY